MTMLSYVSIPYVSDDGSISYSRISLDDFGKNYSGDIGILSTVASDTDITSKMNTCSISTPSANA